MEKLKRKTKYLISTVIILFIGIISLCSTSNALQLHWDDFVSDTKYACFEKGGGFHSTACKSDDHIDLSIKWTKGWKQREVDVEGHYSTDDVDDPDRHWIDTTYKWVPKTEGDKLRIP